MLLLSGLSSDGGGSSASGAGGARFMCSWDTDEARVRQLAADIREVMSA